MKVLVIYNPAAGGGRERQSRFEREDWQGRLCGGNFVLSLPAKQVEVLLQPNEPVQADGDLVGYLPASLKVDGEPVPVQVAESVWRRYHSRAQERATGREN